MEREMQESVGSEMRCVDDMNVRACDDDEDTRSVGSQESQGGSDGSRQENRNKQHGD